MRSLKIKAAYLLTYLLPPLMLGSVSLGFPLLAARTAEAQGSRAPLPEFGPCGPESDDTAEIRDGLGRIIPGIAPPSSDFCAQWNPEFPHNGGRCCSIVKRAKVGGRRRRRSPPKTCTMDRFKQSFCDEITDEQRGYIDGVEEGKVDVLSVINQELGRKGEQAYCTVNNGFLAWGRPVLGTPSNRIVLREPNRCANFGTDHMTGMIEWTGRQLAKEYADTHHAGVSLVVGDISAPRGGCLAGRSGPRGHASHTTGQDADIGFLSAHADRRSPSAFITDFDAKANWWLFKQVFKNPYACVKVIFLDKKLIKKLGKAARGDEDWARYARFIRHMPSHKNHFHVRIGDGPGQPGCFPGANPEDETDELDGIEEEVDLEAMDVSPGPNRKAASI